MKYLRQFGIILLVALAGEFLHFLIPLPVPASIYGLILMLVLLVTGALKLSQVQDVAVFLIEIMPVMFIPASVGLIDIWATIRANLVSYLLITFLTTCAVMFVAGHVTQAVIRKEKKRNSPAGREENHG